MTSRSIEELQTNIEIIQKKIIEKETEQNTLATLQDSKSRRRAYEVEDTIQTMNKTINILRKQIEGLNKHIAAQKTDLTDITNIIELFSNAEMYYTYMAEGIVSKRKYENIGLRRQLLQNTIKAYEKQRDSIIPQKITTIQEAIQAVQTTEKRDIDSLMMRYKRSEIDSSALQIGIDTIKLKSLETQYQLTDQKEKREALQKQLDKEIQEKRGEVSAMDKLLELGKKEINSILVMRNTLYQRVEKGEQIFKDCSDKFCGKGEDINILTDEGIINNSDIETEETTDQEGKPIMTFKDLLKLLPEGKPSNIPVNNIPKGNSQNRIPQKK